MTLPQPASRLACVVGPTAIGKSAVAEEVASHVGGAVVSVDAMQVYRGMDIGTAKTSPNERRVPLYMVDVCDVTDQYSAKRFQQDARRVIDGLLDEGIPPILCGGTGLYLDATIDEMEFPAGEEGDTRRQDLERRAAAEGPQALHHELERVDPESAALIHPNNVRRVIRALELVDEGRRYSDTLGSSRGHIPHYDATLWALTMDREKLYRRIDARVDDMMEAGLLAEVEGLVKVGLLGSTTARQAIGYKELVDYLDGHSSLEEATEKIKQRSRRYAKRQLTWLRHDGRVTWLDMDVLSVADAAHVVMSQGGIS